MMSRIILLLAFLVFLGAALLIHLPLRAVSAMSGVGTEAAVFGTVWNGRVQGLPAGPHRLGDVAVSMRPAGLLAGRAAFDWTVDDPAMSGSGQASAGAGGYRIRDARLLVTPAAFLTLPGGLLTPQDAASLTAERVIWQDGRCIEAAGQVRTDALYALGQRLGAELPGLDGAMVCHDGALALVMSGAAQDATVNAEIRWTPERWTGSARVETQNRDVAAVLEASGFVLQGGVWVMELPGS